MSEQHAAREIELPEPIVERIEARLAYTEFESVDEYLEFVVVEVLDHVEATGDHEGESVDEAVVQDRLKSLGYLNE